MAQREQSSGVAAGASADDMWTKCPACKEIAFRKEVERNLNVCLKCGHHFRLTVDQRLAISVDRGSWKEMFESVAAEDPLEFADSKPYPQRLVQARKSAGRADAIVTGGVAASFAMLGDLNIAEPGALIGFAGRRVIEQTSKQQLPDNFQRAEFLLEHGMLDAIVSRRDLRATLARLLDMMKLTRRR